MKWDIVKYSHENWDKDEYFCNELFNGCNPYTIRVVTHEQLRPEFKQLTDGCGCPIDLSKYGHGELFLSTYEELRDFVYPAVKESNKSRKLYAMEPQILTCIEIINGKPVHKVLAIGFYFGVGGTDFQVFTPKGTWNGIPTPPHLWILAKQHALCADSQTHEIVKHLGMGHMVSEAFAIAHHNTYVHESKMKGNKIVG